MGMFSSPAAVPAKPEPEEDPAQKAAREAIAQQTNTRAAAVQDAAKRRFEGRSMGTEGANATFTGSAAGYGRTMGSANI